MTDDRRAGLLRALRERAGHTQAHAAALVHVHVTSWQRWEVGARGVDETALHLYCFLVGERYEPPDLDEDLDAA